MIEFANYVVSLILTAYVRCANQIKSNRRAFTEVITSRRALGPTRVVAPAAVRVPSRLFAADLDADRRLVDDDAKLRLAHIIVQHWFCFFACL